ncbi:hypothetical protein [Clostridium cylindrosporum]|uniref:Uncharacterized protein n=1 Tax=Clostridium cylindrosporum DSM 605 TaxID=1121307 RepID=A0A0J8G476_CLOCY|nr:hypothetical protein [Clostridium cylindrosporum]KMT22496.1 hypothetical protein CLCY_10c00410 [Clostridium cylindrosporum DSM 605]
MELLLKTFIETTSFTGAIILVGLILGYLRTQTIQNFQRSFGWKAIMITAVVGVPIHELSHTIFSLIFGHRINKIKLIQRPDENGTLGYVQHSYNPLSIYQQVGNFFIGVAPIFGGITALIIFMRQLVPTAYTKLIDILTKNLSINTLDTDVIRNITTSYWEFIKTFFSLSNLGNIYFILFLFLAICISSHISLSTADIKGAFKGLVIMYIFLLIVNALIGYNYILDISLLKYNIILIGFLIVSLIFSLITYLISLILLIFKI